MFNDIPSAAHTKHTKFHSWPPRRRNSKPIRSGVRPTSDLWSIKPLAVYTRRSIDLVFVLRSQEHKICHTHTHTLANGTSPCDGIRLRSFLVGICVAYAVVCVFVAILSSLVCDGFRALVGHDRNIESWALTREPQNSQLIINGPGISSLPRGVVRMAGKGNLH